MDAKRILITGGAGFVGSHLALFLRQACPGLAITAFDNLQRCGSELNVPRLQAAGVEFVRGDLRDAAAVHAWPAFDLLIDCAAEPSVQAGLSGAPADVIATNLTGTIHAVDRARERGAAVLFLSTSRVYPIQAVNAVPYREEQTRYAWSDTQDAAGCSEHGIDESFPLDGPRSLYGATKLAVEVLLTEYAYSYDLPVLIDRCGLLTGPWQMGRVDQGVVALWAARHVFGQPLRYIGFGGQGKQVRDVLHIQDFCQLVERQIARPALWDGRVYNVGGGPDRTVSLVELTELCAEATGHRIDVGSDPATSPVDVRIFATDARKAEQNFGWTPARSVQETVADVVAWVQKHADVLRPVFV